MLADERKANPLLDSVSNTSSHHEAANSNLSVLGVGLRGLILAAPVTSPYARAVVGWICEN